VGSGGGAQAAVSGDTSLRRWTHRTIARVTEDFDRFHPHTAVAGLMEFQHALADAADAETSRRRRCARRPRRSPSCCIPWRPT
jgi:leucyl-tRNA synthetase